MTLSIALFNFFICSARFFFTVKERRLLSIVWFLISYFSFSFVFVVTQGGFSHYQGFTGTYLQVTTDTIHQLAVYMLFFNIIFMLSECLVWRFLRPKKENEIWLISLQSRVIRRMIFSYGLLMLWGVLLYGYTSSGYEYRDYVEFQGSSWGMVFLWAGTPVMTLLALQRRYVIALLFTIPFCYFAIKLHVRSFFLLSVIPVLVIYFFHVLGNNKKNITVKVKKFFGVLIVGLVFFGMSSVVILSKTGRVSLPDYGMPIGAAILFEAIDKTDTQTEWSSLILYGSNIINPILKLAGSGRPDIDDTPVVMARLYDGIPVYEKRYFHYPTLIYTDAYISFKNYGLLLACFWAFMLVLWESVMIRNSMLLAISIPYYCWHAYMLVRGATAVASTPLSYALYVSLIVSLLFYGFRTLRLKKLR